jgi:hypothetical protein
MGRLLLRSTKTEEFPTRVDILFQNVKLVHLATTIHGLVVRSPDDNEQERIIRDTGLIQDDENRFFVIDGLHPGFVVAGVFVTREDKGEYYDSSELWPV